MKHSLIKEVNYQLINHNQFFNIVPRSVEENTVSIGLTFKNSLTIVQFSIPVRTIAKRRLKET